MADIMYPKVIKKCLNNEKKLAFLEIFDSLNANEQYSGFTIVISKQKPEPKSAVRFRVGEELFLALRHLVLKDKFPTEGAHKRIFSFLIGSKNYMYSTGIKSRILNGDKQ
jgi:hypothetical protein